MKKIFVGLLLCLLAGLTMAQDAPPAATVEPAATPIRVDITTFEPRQVMVGRPQTITVYGQNFTAQSTVRFVSLGLGKTTFVNSTILQVDLPENYQAGSYVLEVDDPLNSNDVGPYPLVILAPTATPAPTVEATPIPTLPIPTAIPGKPMLLTRNFSTSSNNVLPGSAVTLTFEVVNQGNQAAQGVSVALASGSKFLPANGQASATLPDIFPNAVASVSLTVIAALDAPAGPNVVPLTLTYRDNNGEIATTTVNLSVNISTQIMNAQVMVARYRYQPSIVRPNDALTLTLLITNAGRDTARGVVVKLGKDGILLPGTNGDSAPVGDLGPGVSTAVDLPLIMKPDAKPGMQLQTISITYYQGTKTDPIETTSSITMEVSAATVQAPLILLKNYTVKIDDTKPDFLTPGQRFTLDFTIENLGNVTLNNVLVVFGTLETSGGSTSGDGSGGSGSGSGTTTTVQPSVVFAPQGSGGTLFVETLEAGGSVQLTQDFIVNGTTKSGIYPLPINLNYRDKQGQAAQTLLNASLVVVTLPRLQISLPAPMPEMAYTNEPLPLSLTIKNVSGVVVKLSEYEIITNRSDDMIDISKGLLKNLPVDEELPINATITPVTTGDITITFILRYVDDLNQTREIRETYTSRIEEAPPVEPPPEETPTPVVTPEPEPLTFGRFLLALLGLGS